MFSRLSLRQKLLIIPALGFIVTAVVIVIMLFLLNKQQSLAQHITTHDIGSINRYTSLLSDFSRNHVALYELLTQHKDNLSSEALSELGHARLTISRQIVNNLDGQYDHDHHRQYSKIELYEQVNQLKLQAESYIDVMSTALEFVSNNRQLEANQLLSEANRRFMESHKLFILLLEAMGKSSQEEINIQIKLFEQNILATTLLVLVALLMLLAFSSRQSGEFARHLHEMIEAMKALANGNINIKRPRAWYNTLELEQLSDAINCFQTSLKQLDQSQQKIAQQNQQLNEEISQKVNAEAELTNALDALQLSNDALEGRVQERTARLAKMNEDLLLEIDQRSKAEKQLQLFKMAVFNTSEAVIITDSNARILEVNPAYCRITGFNRQEVLGQNPNITRSDRHPASFYQEMWQSLSKNGQWSGEIWDRRKNGEVFPKWLTINAVQSGLAREFDENYTFYVGVFMDISSMKQAEQQLEKLAYYDPLTNLPNRVLFHDRLEQELRTAASEHSRFGLLYLDLDRFKYVNDTLGHSVGDQLLVEVGRRIKSCIREPDTVARISGDEFTIIIRSVHEIHDLETVAGKIIEQIEQAVIIGEREVYVGASIGISLYPEHGSSSETLKKHADIAMYQAKEAGRGRYKLFDYKMTDLNVDRMALTTQLKLAVTRQEFVLHYQPIIEIESHAIVAVEALVRWQPENHALIYPNDFIEHAEETGLIHQIGTWVLEAACQQGAQWNQTLKYPLAIAVNLSAVQFENDQLAVQIADVLQRTGLRPELLHVEITETTVMKHPERTETILRDIAALGVAISIDDFGAGYSSLSYLMRFTANKLKIDRAFTQQLTERRNDQIIPTAIINLARSLNLQTVAEGVETVFQLNMLHDKGCQYAQGYLFSKPLPVDELEPLLVKHVLLEDVRGLHL
ncbi:PAS domain S-box-containing protein/diguanylate cyclase (GGDEF) domain-containing protein [Oceanospirillum multiglobuliferum]|uniref:Diguanylate cyclase n=1 Tax=Oceanospirillum multiglobuliferum TaxID=64969 RepID=A0A1T4S078_9GAMM|nr:EAL domain-containing protein [Oceanospirillum multiglobuliferum]OPX54531.1 hypothetical protein BTE48_13655 [Oceanospirillum multiglobuliferum]SKA21679.1 PAS domain S-box-containing protein/diguanylate cyclase (GGDEF) domain-containing protein [Oceanospirillum multiglobuliferum]